jgi:hypothetical protein
MNLTLKELEIIKSILEGKDVGNINDKEQLFKKVSGELGARKAARLTIRKWMGLL